MKNIVFVDQREAGGKVQDARIILLHISTQSKSHRFFLCKEDKYSLLT